MQAAYYLPGETLNPACAPTDSGCGISSIVASSTANSIPYYAANGSVLSATSTFQILSNGTSSTTNLIVGNALTIGTLSGFLKATAGAVATALVNLTSDVTGILPIINGGTGLSALSGNQILYTNSAGTAFVQVATSSLSIGGNAATVTTNANLTGDVTSTGNATAIGSNKVTIGMLAQAAANTILGNLTGAVGNITAFATSTLGIALGDTTGTLALARGGTGVISFTSNQMLYTNAAGALISIATSSLNIGGTALNITGLAAVANGGTGSTTLSGILKGNGTSQVGTLVVGTGLIYDGTTLSTNGTGVTSLAAQYSTGQTGGTQTFATSTADTNLGMSVVSSGNIHTFTPYWIGTLADARIGSAAAWNAKQAALSFIYPLINSANTITSALATTSSNTWGGTQTFTNAPILAALSGIVGVNAGASYSVSTSTLNIGGTALNITGLAAVANGGTGVAAIALGFIPFGNGTSAVATSSSLYWDSTNSRLGIGTTSPLSLLAIGGGVSIGADYNLAAPTNGLIVEGSVGIGTTTPWRNFSLKGTVSSPQFALAYDATRYTQLQTDASGDLSIFTSGGNTRLPDNNLFVCAGGACPTLSITGTGNLTVENKITVGSIEQFCPAGYLWVPGLAQYGTLPGFCTMKYEAKNSAGTAVSVPAGGPWVSIDQPTARAACEALGTGYHLINEAEWMTIATHIATLPINDTDTDASLQLATGHGDNAPASALAAGTSATDPVVSGCNLSVDMENAANAYTSTCQIRGAGAGGSLDADNGYYGTGQTWAATGYVSGASNKSQLRTAVLPNGTVLWDIAGNVWEWTDAYVNGTAEKPAAVTDAWQEFSAITNYATLNYARPKNPSWTSANGIGQYYSGTVAGQRAFIRGGDWDYGAVGGVFTLHLSGAPSNSSTSVGFRCSR
ncbi:MAG: hypothetical protein NT108_03185 [Candidatus Kaiserbacteria bacterium]|nr:hypothetical protein [Candidatus Kaiserbacteria bacterium]